MTDSFAGYSSAAWQTWSLRIWSVFLQAPGFHSFLRDIKCYSDGFSFICDLCFSCFTLAASSCPLFCVFSVLTMIVSCLVFSSKDSMCFLYLYGYVFSEFVEVFFYNLLTDLANATVLRIIYLFSAFNSENWSLMLSHTSCVFLSCAFFFFLNIFFAYFVLKRFSTSSPDILSSAWFILLARISPEHSNGMLGL